VLMQRLLEPEDVEALEQLGRTDDGVPDAPDAPGIDHHRDLMPDCVADLRQHLQIPGAVAPEAAPAELDRPEAAGDEALRQPATLAGCLRKEHAGISGDAPALRAPKGVAGEATALAEDVPERGVDGGHGVDRRTPAAVPARSVVHVEPARLGLQRIGADEGDGEAVAEGGGTR